MIVQLLGLARLVTHAILYALEAPLVFSSIASDGSQASGLLTCVLTRMNADRVPFSSGIELLLGVLFLLISEKKFTRTCEFC